MRGYFNKQRFFQTLAAVNILVVIVLMATIYLIILSPLGQFFIHQVMGLHQESANPQVMAGPIHLLPSQNVYRIKKRQTLLGVAVTRIISQQEPEEFLLLDGVSRPLVDQIYGQTPNLSWVNLIASQLLKLREEGDSTPSSNPSLEIKNIKTLNHGFLSFPIASTADSLNSSRILSHFKHSRFPHLGPQTNISQLPYWDIEIEFKLSNEDSPRFYDAEVIRNIRSLWPANSKNSPDVKAEGITPQNTLDVKQHESNTSQGRDTLLVGYAQKEVFQPELLNNLIQHLSPN